MKVEFNYDNIFSLRIEWARFKLLIISSYGNLIYLVNMIRKKLI